MRKGSVVKNAFGLTIINILISVAGLLRTQTIASVFGLATVTDSYIVASTLPQFFMSFLTIVLSPVFLPLFIEHRSNKEDFFELVNTILWIIIFIGILVTLVIVCFNSQIIQLIVPEFTTQAKQLTAYLSNILVLQSVVISIYSLLYVLLNSYNQYQMPQMAQLIYNAACVLSILFLGKEYGIEGVAWGNLASSLLLIIILVPSIKRLGFKPNLRINLKHDALQKAIILACPLLISGIFSNIYVFMEKHITSGLQTGSITIIDIANKLTQFPISIIGLALATVSFPFFATKVIEQKKEELANIVDYSLKITFIIAVPISVGLVIVARPLVEILFFRGAVNYSNVIGIQKTLTFYSIGIVPQIISMVLAKLYYSVRKIKVIVIIGIVTTLATILFQIILARAFNYGGIALGSSLGAVLNVFMMIIYAYKNIVSFYIKELILVATKCIFASVIMWAGVLSLSRWVDAKILELSLDVVIGIILYIIVMRIFKVKEFERLIEEVMPFVKSTK